MEILVKTLRALLGIDYEYTRKMTINNEKFRKLRKTDKKVAKKFLETQKGRFFEAKIINDDLGFEIVPQEKFKTFYEFIISDNLNDLDTIIIQNKELEEILKEALDERSIYYQNMPRYWGG